MAALLQKKPLVHRDPKKATKQVVMANVGSWRKGRQ